MAAMNGPATLFGQICTNPRTPIETPELADQNDPRDPQWDILGNNDPGDVQWNQSFGTMFGWETVEALIKKREAAQRDHSYQIFANTDPWQPPEPQQRIVNQQKEYFEYVPEWTDPKYNPDARRPIQDKNNFVGSLIPGKGTLPQTAEPTQFAKKYGVYPGRRDGRSRLSPVGSKNLKVKLDNDKQFMFKGIWNTEVDKEVFHMVRYSLFLSKANSAARLGGELLDQFLLANSKTVRPGLVHNDKFYPPELFKACSKFLELEIEQQGAKDYQRYMFGGFDVEELIEKGLFKFDNDVSSELSKQDLHDFLDRRRWIVRHANEPPEDRPRQYWRFPNKDGIMEEGEWSASNDRVWNALEPALQLLTRIIRLQPPAWASLQNLYSRFKIDPDRDPWNTHLQSQASTFKSRVGWEATPTHDRPRFEGLMALHAGGFDLSAGVSMILLHSLRIGIGSCHRGVRVGTCHRGKEGTPNQRDPAHGLTYLYENGLNLKIWLVIGAELLWPLLSPDTTESEKLSCSFAVACSMYHEFGHAIELACYLLPKHPYVVPGLSMEQLAQLVALGDTLFGDNLTPIGGWTRDDFTQPFFEDDPVAEPGHAMVNDFFGGTVNRLQPYPNAPMPQSLNLAITELFREQWPPAASRPWLRNGEINPILLRHPELPRRDTHTAMPFSSYLKYFQNSLWEKDLPKYGLEAMKLYNNDAIIEQGKWLEKNTVSHGDLEEALVQQYFGLHRGAFVYRALNVLDKYGYHDISQHLKTILRLHLWDQYTERRWHKERRMWPRMRQEMDKCTKELQKAGADCAAALDVAQGSAENLNKWHQELVATGELAADSSDQAKILAQRKFQGMFEKLLAKIRHFDRLCSARLSYFQSLAREYLTQTFFVRQKLEARHGDRIRKEIRCGVDYPIGRLNLAGKALVRQIWADEPIDGVDVSELERRMERLRLLTGFLESTRSIFTPNKVHATAEYTQFFTESQMGPGTKLESSRLAALKDCERLRDPYVTLIVSELCVLIHTVTLKPAGIELDNAHKIEFDLAKTSLMSMKLVNPGPNAPAPAKPNDDVMDWEE